MTTNTDGDAWREAPLLLWLSPAFPVGAFAYSHGLEWAFEAGDVTDAASLAAWLADLARFGAPQLDAALFAHALPRRRRRRLAGARRGQRTGGRARRLGRAAAGDDRAGRRVSPSPRAPRGTARRWRGSPRATASRSPIRSPSPPRRRAAAWRSSRAAEAFVVGQFANLVSAATRLGVVGQTDGLKILAGILPELAALAREAADAPLDDLGACALRSDIAAMRHETQYSRLFRS